MKNSLRQRIFLIIGLLTWNYVNLFRISSWGGMKISLCSLKNSISKKSSKLFSLSNIQNNKFREFGVPEWLIESLTKMNYTEPTHVQAKAFPVSLSLKQVLFLF